MSLARVTTQLATTIIRNIGDDGGALRRDVESELNNIITFANTATRTLFTDANTRVTDANTNEKDFSSTTLAANELNADGDFLLVFSNIQYANNGNTKRYRIYFAGNAMFDTGAVVFTNVSQFIVGFMMRRASTFITGAFGTLITAAGAGTGAQFNEFGSQNFATTNIVKSTGQNGAASALDITQRGFILLKGSA